MPVVKPGKPVNGKASNIDFTFIVPKGATVKIEYYAGSKTEEVKK